MIIANKFKKSIAILVLFIFIFTQVLVSYAINTSFRSNILKYINTSLYHNNFSHSVYNFSNSVNNFRHKIISAPIDVRPISNEYLENLINLGGDILVKPNKAYLDQGPSSPTVSDWIFGDSPKLRNDILNNVKKNNSSNTTVIINSSSYIFGGLVGSRVPSNYNDDSIEDALKDLENMVTQYCAPRYYMHIMMPRVIPETRGFDYKTNHMGYGLTYFYNKHNSPSTADVKTSYPNMLIEYGYIKNKKTCGKKLQPWETDFINSFMDNYVLNTPDEFKYKGVPIATLYEKIFERTGNLIKKSMALVSEKKLDEMVISMDDYVIPAFIVQKSTENWIDKDQSGNPIKYSFGKKYIDDVIAYQKKLFGNDSIDASYNGMGKQINYIFGTDEIPQMIYARDLTKRKGFATNIEVDYSKDINPERSKKHIGYFEATSTEKLITQRLNYVTRKLPNSYEAGVRQHPFAKKFIIFVHNSDAKDEQGKNYLFDKNQAATFAKSVYSAYNAGHNVGVLDLMTNLVDWNLFTALAETNGNSISQLGCYSGFNTIGNSTGLGIAHAQVFGTIDLTGDFNYPLEDRANAQCQVLAQHLLEDGIYNARIKYYQPNSYNYIKSSINNIYNSSTMYDSSAKPGGAYWVMNKFIGTKMRLNNTEYTWNSYTVTADLPLNRTFECIINTDFSK